VTNIKKLAARIERERAEGIDPADAAGRWLAENAHARPPVRRERSPKPHAAAGAVGCRHAWATIVPHVSPSYRYCLGCGARRDSEVNET
jgi:hypothetical protein